MNEIAINILVVIAAIAIFIALYYFGYRKQLNQILLYLVTKAEQEFGGGTGPIKYGAVVAWVYERVPSIVKIFLTKKELDRLIEQSVVAMKQYLEGQVMTS